MNLESVRQVIDAMGGIDAAASLAGVRRKAAYAWRNHLGKFPPDTYLLFTEELRLRGHVRPPPSRLWGMRVHPRSKRPSKPQ